MAMTKEQKSEFNLMLQKLQKLLPNAEVRKQPQTALSELLQLEKQFQINTSDVINRTSVLEKSNIPEKVIENWIFTFRIFKTHKGNLDDINNNQNSIRDYLRNDENKDEYKEKPNPSGFGYFLYFIFYGCSLYLNLNPDEITFEN